MTEATNITFPARRTDDFRLVAGVSTAHFVSHFYMLVLPPLFAFVRADYAVSYTEIGLALTMFHLVAIPISNASLNPARSTATAIFGGAQAINALWLFWVAPIAGALLGSSIYKKLGVPGK